jgi:predicted Zn-dependent protease
MRTAVNLTVFLISLASFQSANSEVVAPYEPYEKGVKSPVIKTAAEHEEQFVRRGLRFNDAELLEIVNRVADNVVPTVADSYIDFRVYLIRDPSPAAFSLADGQIYIHTGLLARLENEAQLAAVLAHEAHHIAAHDQIVADRNRRNKQNIGGAAIGLLNLNTGDGVGYESEYRYIAQSEFSPEMEYAADAAAAKLLSQAGYAPDAVPRALEIFRQDPELTVDRQFASDVRAC